MRRSRNFKKNTTKLTLTLFLLIGILLIPGYAVRAEESTEYGTLLYSGTCGAPGNEENVTWAVYDSGADEDEATNTADTLVLSGEGEMADFEPNSYPWYFYSSKLTKVIFADDNEITSLGDYAFYNCTGLSDITIPSSVTSIDNSAFLFCKIKFEVAENNTSYSSEDGILYNKDKTILVAYQTASGEVTIPDSVTEIADNAFRGCSELTQITIPNSVTSIGDYAFYNCFKLVNISISKNVTNIGNSAFEGYYSQ